MRKYTRKSPKTTTATPPITGWCLTKDMTPTFSLPPWFAALTNQPNHRGAGSCVCQVDETAGQLLVAQVHPSETADVRHPGQYRVQSAGKVRIPLVGAYTVVGSAAGSGAKPRQLSSQPGPPEFEPITRATTRDPNQVL